MPQTVSFPISYISWTVVIKVPSYCIFFNLQKSFLSLQINLLIYQVSSLPNTLWFCFILATFIYLKIKSNISFQFYHIYVVLIWSPGLESNKFGFRSKVHPAAMLTVGNPTCCVTLNNLLKLVKPQFSKSQDFEYSIRYNT